MLDILADRTYRHLFTAQVIALVGTGLATVALGLLAYDLAGGDAGVVLGTALAIKMIAYVGVAPVAAAFAERLPRRAMLVSLDFVRAAVALLLPFVSEVWQVYVLIFVLQAASAGFTPTFQATIPDVLPDEKDYTRALSLSRLAYDLESLVSPMLAAALLTVVSFHSLFAGTVIGFLASAALVVSVILPSPKPSAPRGVYDRTTRGIRIYLATPRLRGLLAVNLAVAAAGAMVIVNTVVIVQASFGLSQRETALALAAFGGGSMVAALALPKLLELIPDRTAMLAGNFTARRGPAGRRERSRLPVPPAALVRPRTGVFGGADAFRPPAAAIVASRGSTGPLCRPVCAVACLLARHLSAGRMAGRDRRAFSDVRDPGVRRRRGGCRCHARLARSRSGHRGAPPPRSSRRRSPLGRGSRPVRPQTCPSLRDRPAASGMAA